MKVNGGLVSDTSHIFDPILERLPFPDKSGFASWGCWHVNQVQNAEWVGLVLDETAV